MHTPSHSFVFGFFILAGFYYTCWCTNTFFSLNCAAWRVFHVIFQRSVLFFLLPMDSRSILLIFPFSLVGWVSASLYLQSPLFLCLLCAFPVLIGSPLDSSLRDKGHARCFGCRQRSKLEARRGLLWQICCLFSCLVLSSYMEETTPLSKHPGPCLQSPHDWLGDRQVSNSATAEQSMAGGREGGPLTSLTAWVAIPASLTRCLTLGKLFHPLTLSFPICKMRDVRVYFLIRLKGK